MVDYQLHACVHVCVCVHVVCLGLNSSLHLPKKCVVYSFHFNITTESGSTSMNVPGGSCPGTLVPAEVRLEPGYYMLDCV